MRRTFLFFQFLLISLIVISCGKEDLGSNEYGTLIFYKQSTGGSFTVYINQINNGEVPYVNRTPACNTTEGLRLRLAPGTHAVEVRNNNNPVWSYPESITISRGECRLYRVQ